MKSVWDKMICLWFVDQRVFSQDVSLGVKGRSEVSSIVSYESMQVSERSWSCLPWCLCYLSRGRRGLITPWMELSILWMSTIS